MIVNSINGISFAQKISKINTKKNVQSPKNIFVSMPDTVSFKSNYVQRNVKPDVETMKIVTDSLSNSTSGHRAEYNSKTFTPEIVETLTLGVAKYAKENAKDKNNPTVLIGGDTREATRKSLPLINKTLLGQNVNVVYIDKPVPTPLLALTAKKNDVDLAILMTASHNPWKDGGYNLVTNKGSIAPAEVTKEVAKDTMEITNIGTYMENQSPKATSTTIYPYELYKEEMDKLGVVDWGKIKDSNISVFYDSLNGTGENVMPRLLDDNDINHTIVHSSGQEGPNPTKENLAQLSNEVRNSKDELKIGISNDGDADRFGIIDENGEYVHPNDVLLLASYHLAKNKGIKGTIVRSQATTSQLDTVSDKYGLDVKVTPVGFKFLGEDMLKLRDEGKDILLAGEESGGLTIQKHIPEKDGILATSLILDLVATEKKPVSVILKDVKEDLGTNVIANNFSYKMTNNEDKKRVMDGFNKMYQEALAGSGEFCGISGVDKDKTKAHEENIKKYKPQGDGMKVFYEDGSSILIRKSGTEPLVRFYVETRDKDKNKAKEQGDLYAEKINKIFDKFNKN